MTLVAAMTVAACLAANPASDQITAGELAAAIPGLTAPDPAIPVAWAPAPGAERVFRVAELRRLALRLGWSAQPAADLCVARPVAPPDPAVYLSAMRRALPEAEIALLDYTRQPIPAGEIAFPAGALRPAPGGALWNGYVRYAGTRHFAIWARVEIQLTVTRVVAAVDLAPGRPISADQLLLETRRDFPSPAPFLHAPAEASGRWPRRPIRAGTILAPAMLRDPQAVQNGDAVTVEVHSGAAYLQLEARAEGSGAVGETVTVRNLSSNRPFRARVEAKGRVSVKIPDLKVKP